MIGKIKKLIYKLATCRAHHVKGEGFFSQYGQDRYIDEVLFNKMQNGTFVDIGANDGITLSNTYHFEKELAWSGIAIEPLPQAFQKLQENRSCIKVQGCIADFDGETQFLAIQGYAEMLSGIIKNYDERHTRRIEDELKEFGGKKEIITVKCYTLQSILKQFSFSKIDYLSIDTEGGEFDILKSIDFRNLDIDVVSVENNYSSLDFLRLMNKFDYKLVAVAGGDEIYKKCRS
jgi:FkbM family methyltransferase